MEAQINPLDYATRFTFPVKDSTVGAKITVLSLGAQGQWMIRREDNDLNYDMFTVDGRWIQTLVVDLASAEDVAKVAYERGRAIAVAHRLANP